VDVVDSREKPARCPRRLEEEESEESEWNVERREGSPLERGERGPLEVVLPTTKTDNRAAAWSPSGEIVRRSRWW